MDSVTDTKRGGVIQLNPFPKGKVYGVVMTFDVGKKIQFKVRISCEKILDKGDFLFHVNREQVYINNKVPEQLIDKLADELGKYLYPLELGINREGHLVDVVNHAALIRSWEEHRAGTERYYQGAVAEKILRQFDQDIRRKEKLLQALREDWFFAVYFSGIYSLKPYDFRNRTAVDLPMEPGLAPTRYYLTREISRQSELAGMVLIDCKGQVGDTGQANGGEASLEKGQESTQQVLQEQPGLKGDAWIRYRLYRKDFSIRSIVCESRLRGADGMDRQVQVEIYDQNREQGA